MIVRHAYVHPDDVVHDLVIHPDRGPVEVHLLLDPDEERVDVKTGRTVRGPQRLIIAAEHDGPCAPECAELTAGLGSTVQRRAWLEARPDARIES